MEFLDKSEEIKRLASKLSQLDNVKQHDIPNEPEGWRLAYSISELEASFNKINSKIIPMLANEKDHEKLNDALHELGEEFRHILYHIKDPKYFRYLLNPSELPDEKD